MTLCPSIVAVAYLHTHCETNEGLYEEMNLLRRGETLVNMVTWYLEGVLCNLEILYFLLKLLLHLQENLAYSEPKPGNI